MKVGDLVTLSTYSLQTAAMWKWKQMIWSEKKNLVGLIVRIEDNPWNRKHTSKNEKKFYYVRWIQDGPGSRFGRTYHATDGYFLRNDLKFFK
tara:strand:+ start:19001 stop:19276 length:276 start_codon:yes stop_codon:yes gene_type:complete